MAKIAVNCAWCGCELLRKKSAIDRVENSFCNIQCRSAFRTGKPFQCNPVVLSVPCANCDQMVERLKSQVNGSNTFCSPECSAQHRKGKPQVHEGSFVKGMQPWNKGLTEEDHLGVRAMADATRMHPPMSTEAARIKSSLSHTGKVLPIEQRRRMSEAQLARVAAGLNNFYIDGRYAETKKRRMSSEYYIWRDLVFRRDDFTCQECGQHGGYLEAHHVQRWSEFPELRYEASNGVTLCLPCHARADNFRAMTIPKSMTPAEYADALSA